MTRDGTRVVFDLDFDHGAWPGPLGDGDAVVDEVWLGPLGLVGFLELRLGLSGPAPTALERSLALLRALRAREGFWSRSLEADPLGTARHVLGLRDQLCLAGLDARELDPARAPRLASLLRVARDLPAGLPERLRAVAAQLGRLDPGLRALRLLEDPTGLPHALRQVVEALRARGLAPEPVPPAAVEARGDLRAARGTAIEPSGDGSLVLLRPQGVLEAAEEVAAWLAPDHGQAVVISPDPVLDAALRRHGLPALGAAPAAADTALLAALPLALELGLAPQDPQKALDLLNLPEGPVPPGLARALLEVLRWKPAVGNREWNQRVEAYLAKVEDPRRQEALAELLMGLFSARVARGAPCPAREAKRRAESLLRWARGEREGATAVRAQCAAFGDLVDAYGRDALDARELSRLVEEASLHAPVAGLPAEAGLARVGRPGGVAGPCRRVVWWRFVASAAGGPRELPAWVAREARASGLGDSLPDLRALAVRQAARERRPFEQAGEALLLVAPARGEDGQEEYPHPAWGEIASRVTKRALLPRLSAARLQGVARTRREACSPPVPAPVFHAPPRAVGRPDELHPTELENLLGCPLAWTLGWLGLAAGASVALERAGGAALEGTLAHEALEQALLGPLPSPDEAEARALSALERAMAERGAVYLLPGSEGARERLRATVRFAARDLAHRLAALGLTVRAVEQRLEGPALGGKIVGRLDLVLGDPPAVLDLKRGWGSGRGKSLKAGTAVQLAAYSMLLRSGRGPWPAVAYYILEEAALLSTDGRVFRGGTILDGRGPEETWRDAERGVESCREELEAGLVRARGVAAILGEPAEEKEEIGLRTEPPCGFCDYRALCGRAFLGG